MHFGGIYSRKTKDYFKRETRTHVSMIPPPKTTMMNVDSILTCWSIQQHLQFTRAPISIKSLRIVDKTLRWFERASIVASVFCLHCLILHETDTYLFIFSVNIMKNSLTFDWSCARERLHTVYLWKCVFGFSIPIPYALLVLDIEREMIRLSLSKIQNDTFFMLIKPVQVECH